MDLHIIKLKNGEELLCKNYYIFTNDDEYRLEVLTSSTGEANFDYYVLKEEIESIATYSNCFVKSTLDDIYTETDDGSYMKSEEGKKKIAELKKLIDEHPFTLEADFGKPIDTYLKPNNLTEEQLNYYTPVAADEHITIEYQGKEYVWSNEFNQYIPKVKGYITTKEK